MLMKYMCSFVLLTCFVMAGCISTDKPIKTPIGNIPAMDAYNNVTGEPGSDGKTDQAYLDYVHAAKTTVDTVTGGATAPASGIAETVIGGVSAVIVALAYAWKKKKEGDEDHDNSKKAVQAIAAHVNMPLDKLPPDMRT